MATSDRQISEEAAEIVDQVITKTLHALEGEQDTGMVRREDVGEDLSLLPKPGAQLLDEPGSPPPDVKTYDVYAESLKTPLVFNAEQYVMENIQWCSIQEFTIDKGKDMILAFLQTWQHDDRWLYCVDYLSTDHFEFDVRHRYQVMWSIPTKRKPVPRATACIYFTISVSKFKPKTHPIEVFYIFETNRLVHRPGRSRFRQQWLLDIIHSKVHLAEEITF